jgi:hypothetical protein
MQFVVDDLLTFGVVLNPHDPQSIIDSLLTSQHDEIKYISLAYMSLVRPILNMEPRVGIRTGKDK